MQWRISKSNLDHFDYDKKANWLASFLKISMYAFIMSYQGNIRLILFILCPTRLCSFLKVKGCYSRFNFHVLDYGQWLRMPHDLWIRECLINKLNYGVLHQLPATAGHINFKQQTFTFMFNWPLVKVKYVIEIPSRCFIILPN